MSWEESEPPPHAPLPGEQEFHGSRASTDKRTGMLDLTFEKGLPQSLDTERFLLGSILLNGSRYTEVAEALVADDFALEKHRRIFARMADLHEQGEPIDRITLAEALIKHGQLESVDGLAYLTSLDDGLPEIQHITSYIRIVKEKSALRKLIFASQRNIDMALIGEEDPQSILSKAETSIRVLNQEHGRKDAGKTPHDIVTDFGNIGAFLDPSQRPQGLMTGFHKFDEMTTGLHPGEQWIIGGRTSQGKAQPLTSKVLTRDGWKAMGDLRVGDELASVDGAPSRVLGVFPQGKRDTFRLTFSDGRSAVSTDDHLWNVGYWNDVETMPLSKLRAKLSMSRYATRLWVPLYDGDHGEDVDLPLDPWLLGFLLGDGCITRAVLFSCADPSLVERVRGIVARYGCEVGYKDHYDWVIRRIGGCNAKGTSGVLKNPIKEILKTLGVHGLNSSQKFIPEIYMRASKRQRLELLRGLLDTDGHVQKRGPIDFVTTSERMGKQVLDLARSIGAICRIAEKQPTCRYKGVLVNGAKAYRLSIRHDDKNSLVSLERKKCAAPTKRPIKLTIRSIEPEGHEECQCIQVSHPTGLYVTDDYVVTHNTALALCIALHLITAKPKPFPVSLYSMEMSGLSLLDRLVCMQAHVDQQKFRLGFLNQDERRRLQLALAELMECPLHIYDSGISPEMVENSVRRDKEKHGLALSIVDYIQLFGRDKRGGDGNRNNEIASISRRLKMLWAECEIPGLVLSQVGRSSERRSGGDNRPQLQDLRDSGAIEEDANGVLFVFREGYYKRDREDLKGLAEGIIAKQRNGPVGTVKLRFIEAYARFENRAEDYHDDPEPAPAPEEELHSRRAPYADN